MKDSQKKLPPSWAEIELGKLIADTTSVDPKSLPTKMFELWSVPSFETGFPELVKGAKVGSNKQDVTPGDVLLCKINPRINRVWLVGKRTNFDQIASTEWIVLRSTNLYPKFILYQLREDGFRQRLLLDLSGIGGSLTRARPRIVGQLTLKLAPLNEQKRIVARIEELQVRSRRAKEALETIPDLLKQLRQSILAAAFRGDLTKEWREKHPDVERASELLKRILAERRKRWEEAEREKLIAKGLSGEKLDEEFAIRRKQYKEPAPVDPSDLPELPEEWCWASIEELSHWITDGTHQPPPFADRGIPFLVISNMVSGDIAWDTIQKWVSTETYEKYTGIYKPALGDIIYSTVGSYGVAVEVMTHKKFMFQRHIAHIRPISKNLSASYLSFSLNSPICKEQADEVARGVAQKTVNLSDLRRFAIPLAPLSEQYKLNELLSKSFEILDNQRHNLNSSLTKLYNFEQSILSKAFRGELVTQDTNDEPAAILLERILQEKARESAQPIAKDKRKDKKMKKSFQCNTDIGK